MANYFLSKKAVEDLSDIWLYTFDSWSERQADKYYHSLIEACKDLAKAKVRGKQYPEMEVEIFGYRILQHIILYRLVQRSNIEIVRILHSSMDLKNRVIE